MSVNTKAIGTRVVIIGPKTSKFIGHTGVITAVRGPSTVTVKLDKSGINLWSYKLSNIKLIEQADSV